MEGCLGEGGREELLAARVPKQVRTPAVSVTHILSACSPAGHPFEQGGPSLPSARQAIDWQRFQQVCQRPREAETGGCGCFSRGGVEPLLWTLVPKPPCQRCRQA